MTSYTLVIHLRFRSRHQSLFLQILCNLHNSGFHARVHRVDVNLWFLRLFIRRRNTSEFLDFPSSSLFVQPLGIALFRVLDGDVYVNLDEGERGVDVFGRGVEVAGELAVGCVWRDERGESESCRVGEEFCDLW